MKKKKKYHIKYGTRVWDTRFSSAISQSKIEFSALDLLDTKIVSKPWLTNKIVWGIWLFWKKNLLFLLETHNLTKTEKDVWIFCFVFCFFVFFHLSQWLSFCSKPRSTKPLPFISIESTTSSSTILWSKSLTLSLTKIHPFSVKANLCESPNRQIPSIWRWKAPIQSRPRSKMKKSSPNKQHLIFAGKQSECTLADYNI